MTRATRLRRAAEDGSVAHHEALADLQRSLGDFRQVAVADPEPQT